MARSISPPHPLPPPLTHVGAGLPARSPRHLRADTKGLRFSAPVLLGASFQGDGVAIFRAGPLRRGPLAGFPAWT